ncbi:hypothetical protein BJ508DRAFT_363217 [Ascobolus immersus RN42]|uniref:Uncharacterized protein n=1 Tax=Ascobolus immersus RN42 TaxID=1160509 RepID=A0A3N4I044_ASCIM|nr:hypothetical protein BJ508DRAFT_363217 [Ascobolus immersus RN42]
MSLAHGEGPPSPISPPTDFSPPDSPPERYIFPMSFDGAGMGRNGAHGLRSGAATILHPSLEAADSFNSFPSWRSLPTKPTVDHLNYSDSDEEESPAGFTSSSESEEEDEDAGQSWRTSSAASRRQKVTSAKVHQQKPTQVTTAKLARKTLPPPQPPLPPPHPRPPAAAPLPKQQQQQQPKRPIFRSRTTAVLAQRRRSTKASTKNLQAVRQKAQAFIPKNKSNLNLVRMAADEVAVESSDSGSDYSDSESEAIASDSESEIQPPPRPRPKVNPLHPPPGNSIRPEPERFQERHHYPPQRQQPVRHTTFDNYYQDLTQRQLRDEQQRQREMMARHNQQIQQQRQQKYLQQQERLQKQQILEEHQRIQKQRLQQKQGHAQGHGKEKQAAPPQAPPPIPAHLRPRMPETSRTSTELPTTRTSFLQKSHSTHSIPTSARPPFKNADRSISSPGPGPLISSASNSSTSPATPFRQHPIRPWPELSRAETALSHAFVTRRDLQVGGPATPSKYHAGKPFCVSPFDMALKMDNKAGWGSGSTYVTDDGVRRGIEIPNSPLVQTGFWDGSYAGFGDDYDSRASSDKSSDRSDSEEDLTSQTSDTLPITSVPAEPGLKRNVSHTSSNEQGDQVCYNTTQTGVGGRTYSGGLTSYGTHAEAMCPVFVIDDEDGGVIHRTATGLLKGVYAVKDGVQGRRWWSIPLVILMLVGTAFTLLIVFGFVNL